MPKKSTVTLIAAILQKERYAVLATKPTGRRNPAAALVAFTALADLSLIFGTLRTTRKYNNLKANARVAVVISSVPKKKISIQYEGIAHELTGKELRLYRQQHVAKHPTSKKYAFAADERFFKVTPTWIRYVDYSVEPHVIAEVVLGEKAKT